MQTKSLASVSCLLALAAAPAAHAESAGSFLRHLPQRTAGIVVGTLVGTPIALARCTKRELVAQTKLCYDLGGVPKPIGYITAGAFGIPSGIMCGAWYGAADGVADSVVNSKEPFGKASLSLDKLTF